MKQSLKLCPRNHFEKTPFSNCHHPKPQCKNRPLIQNRLTFLHWNSFRLTSKSNFLSIFSPQPQLPVHTLSEDRKSTRLNSSHLVISYAVFCLKKKKYLKGYLLTYRSEAHTSDIPSHFPHFSTFFFFTLDTT